MINSLLKWGVLGIHFGIWFNLAIWFSLDQGQSEYSDNDVFTKNRIYTILYYSIDTIFCIYTILYSIDTIFWRCKYIIIGILWLALIERKSDCQIEPYLIRESKYRWKFNDHRWNFPMKPFLVEKLCFPLWTYLIQLTFNCKNWKKNTKLFFCLNFHLKNTNFLWNLEQNKIKFVARICFKSLF